MIDIETFESFLLDIFAGYEIEIDDFKNDLKFIDVDCFLDKPYKLTIALSADDIRIATISKEPELDFSLYDYFFSNSDAAKNFVLDIKRSGIYPKG